MMSPERVYRKSVRAKREGGNLRREFCAMRLNYSVDLAQRKPTKGCAPSGGWLSRYSTQRLTGAAPQLPPRITRRVLTLKKSNSFRCKKSKSGALGSGFLFVLDFLTGRKE